MAIVDNIMIIDKDNKFVGYTSIKKGNWFVKKKLGEYRDEKTLQIFFEPKRYPKTNNANEYKIDNKCVVCGYEDDEKDELNKEYTSLNSVFIVPSEFIKKYPLEIRQNQRTIKKIILCETCTGKYNKLQKKNKLDLYEKYKLYYDYELSHINKLCKQILANRRGKKIKDIEDTLIKNLKKYFNEKEITEDIIRNYSIIPPSRFYKNLNGKDSPEEYIIEQYINTNKLQDFESIWIELFLTEMKPQFLLKNWKELVFDC